MQQETVEWIISSIFFCVGAAIGFVWLTGALLPLLYALPKAVYWVRRGLFSWRLPIHFAREALVVILLTAILFTAVLIAISAWAPPRAREAYSLGHAAGFVVAAYLSFTREGRKALRMEFVRVALR